MKKTILFIFMAFTAITVSAQRILEFKNISGENDIFSTDSAQCLLTIRCHKDIKINKFYTQVDGNLNPYWTEIEGSDSLYNFSLPTGKDCDGRNMTISAVGFYNVSIPLGDMQPKRIYTYHLTDPDALVDVGCYREHRNKGMDELKHLRYIEAREQFILAKECSDNDSIENEHNIAMVDSIISYQKKAVQETELFNYAKAAHWYQEIFMLNPYDKFALQKRDESQQKYTSDCELYFKQAEFYYNDKEYDKAKELYNKVIRNNCLEASMAQERLNKMNEVQITKKDHARVFTYEYMKNMPIGFHYGKYKMKKAGGFINLNFSGNIFKFAKGDLHYNSTSNSKYPKQDFPEMNINFGWTIKIANPVWIYFGPGASAKFYFGHYEEFQTGGVTDPTIPEKYPTSKEAIANQDFDSKKINVAIAVSPTVGLTIKYSWFAVRVGYEYRYSIKSQLRDFMGEHRITVGAGIAW